MQSICSTEPAIDYPIVDFPIKVMGIAHEDFEKSVAELLLAHDPKFRPEEMSARLSSKGNYVSLTAPIFVESREHLERIYRALNALPLSKMVL